MNRLRDTYLKNKDLLWGALVHGGILWGALSLAYNSYKEYMREYDPLSMAIRDSIKAMFPLAILIFVILYILYGIGRKGDGYPSFKQYVIIFFLQFIIINPLVFHKGSHIIIPSNLSLLYFAILLFVWGGFKRFIFIETSKLARELIPPIIYHQFERNLPQLRGYFYEVFERNKPRIKAYFKEKPSAPFIIAFMSMLIFCAFLLIIKQEEMAEDLANIAYFSIVIGVGIEVYQLLRYGEKDKGKEDNEIEE